VCHREAESDVRREAPFDAGGVVALNAAGTIEFSRHLGGNGEGVMSLSGAIHDGVNHMGQRICCRSIEDRSPVNRHLSGPAGASIVAVKSGPASRRANRKDLAQHAFTDKAFQGLSGGGPDHLKADVHGVAWICGDQFFQLAEEWNRRLLEIHKETPRQTRLGHLKMKGDWRGDDHGIECFLVEHLSIISVPVDSLASEFGDLILSDRRIGNSDEFRQSGLCVGFNGSTVIGANTPGSDQAEVYNFCHSWGEYSLVKG